MKNPGRSLSRNTLTSFSLGAVLLLATACGTGETTSAPVESPSTVVESPSASSSSTTEVPSTLKVGEQGVKPGDVINGIPTLPELANDGKGEYIQTTISDDDPAMQLNTALFDEKAEQIFTNEELTEAHRFIVRFMAEEAIDSTINNNVMDVANIDAWWAKNKHKIHPSQHETFYSELVNENKEYALVNRTGREHNLLSGKDKVRVTERVITPTYYNAVTLNGSKYFALDSEASYHLLQQVGDKVVPEVNTAELSFTVTKNSAGEWVIVGYQNTFYIW